MAISKRRKALREKEIEEEKKWLEKQRLNPPPPPPPWTDAQLGIFDKAEKIISRLWTSDYEDPDSVSEFLRLSCGIELDTSRTRDMASKLNHYRTLVDQSAKARIWSKLRQNFIGVKTQVDSLRRSRERGGQGVQ